MTDPIYDLAIIGGGINGCGIAADAAGRGLEVLLAEKGDLAGATSSASSKLIHGGLRYLEHYEFRLVREALQEREVLLAMAPHIIRPLRFVLPVVPGMRPRIMIRAGLVIYDHLARRKTIPASTSLDLAQDPAGRALVAGIAKGFAYWDCWVDDARLVVLNARAADDRGAEILTRTRVRSAVPSDGIWRVSLEANGQVKEVMARALVNAAGPWVDEVGRSLRGNQEAPEPARLRLVKGSHIVVPRIAGAEDAYLMQSWDGRVVFALPFEERFTLIGTTDVPFTGDPGDAAISAGEEAYLLGLAGRFFAKPPVAADIVWRFAGVRPLFDDSSGNPSKVSRDYRLDLDAGPGRPPLLSVLGGKVTTYRRLAEAALAKLAPHLPPMGPAWTAAATLPGGDLGEAGIEGLRLELGRRYPAFDPSFLLGLARRYGTRAAALLGDARRPADLGEPFGAGLTEREVAFLRQTEWAQQPDDILWRRTKAGLHLAPQDRQRVSAHLARVL